MGIFFVSDVYRLGGLETHLLTTFKFLKKKKPSLPITFFSFIERDVSAFSDIGLYCDIFNLSKEEIKSNRYESFFLFKEALLKESTFNPPRAIVAHPFYSFFSSFYVAVKKNIPLIIFLHGKLSSRFNESVLNDVFRSWILPNALVFTVNPSLGSSYCYLPNPIDEDLWTPSNLGDDNYILLVSRLDWEKERGIIKVLTDLQKQNLPIKVVGKGDSLEKLKARFPNVQFLGAKSQEEIKNLMERATLVCGMGRGLFFNGLRKFSLVDVNRVLLL